MDSGSRRIYNCNDRTSRGRIEYIDKLEALVAECERRFAFTRKSSPLKEIMRLMDEIDQAIESHGGWPIE